MRDPSVTSAPLGLLSVGILLLYEDKAFCYRCRLLGFFPKQCLVRVVFIFYDSKNMTVCTETSSVPIYSPAGLFGLIPLIPNLCFVAMANLAAVFRDCPW